MSSDRPFPPGIESFDDLLRRVESVTEARIKTKRGYEVVLSPCPLGSCVGDKFSIHRDKGAWNCPKCGERGNAWDLVERLGIGPVRPAFPDCMQGPWKSSEESPRRLGQGEVDSSYETYRLALDTNEKVKAELERRSVSMETARTWGLCAKGNAVGFPYRRRDGSLAFVKFKDVGSGKQWRWPKKAEMPLPAKTPLFHLPAFDPTDDVILTEGEWDALSLSEVGLYNAASIAGGCRTWDPEWTKHLASSPGVYLAYDQDGDGEAGLLRPAAALGREVCFRLVFGRHKDASDALRTGWDESRFRSALDAARRLRPEILKSLPELASDLVERMKSGDVAGRIDTGFAQLDRTQRGLRTGELTVLTANTGMGKTTVTLDVALRIAERGDPVLYVSMEQSPEATVGQLLSMLCRQAIEDMTDDDLDAAARAAPAGFFLAVEPDRDRVEHVVQAIRYARIVHEARFVVVDHLDYLIEVRGREARHEAAGRAVKALHAVARDSDVHVILICQPTTESGRSRHSGPRTVQFEDIAETRLATQLPHNGWVWSSKKGDRVGRLFVRKARYNAAQEEITIEFKFDGFRFSELSVRPGRPK